MIKKVLSVLAVVVFFCFPLVVIGFNHETTVHQHPDWGLWDYMGCYVLIYIVIFFTQCCVGMLWAMEDL